MNTSLLRILYVQTNQEYKKLCCNKKKTYYNSIVNNIKESKNSKELWSNFNALKAHKFITEPHFQINDWVNHFKQLLNPPIQSSPISFAVPLIQNEFLDSNFSADEVKRIINKTKNNKAPGLDRTPFEFFKNLPPETLNTLVDIYNKIWNSNKVPDSFKKSIIFPIHKKGKINEISNYRGISLIDSIAKIFTGVLEERLKAFVEENQILNESQAGFRPGYSTVDNP